MDTYSYTLVDHFPEYTFSELLRMFVNRLTPVLNSIVDAGATAANILVSAITCADLELYSYDMIDHAPEYEPVRVEPTGCDDTRCGCDEWCFKAENDARECNIRCPAGLK